MVTNAYHTNALGDATCNSQTDFQCVGGRLDMYGALTDGAGTSSRLVKSGRFTLNITGDLLLGNDPNTYTGGTIVNAGGIKMQKMPGINAIPGDVTVNGSGSLVMNILGGEQIDNSAIVTLNDFGSLQLGGQPETVQTVQSSSAGASIALGSRGTLTVAPLAAGTYNGGTGISDFAGSISGGGTVQMDGTGTYGMMGVNSVANLVVNSGTLKVNGNSGTGLVMVNTNGALLGQGTVAGPVIVAEGGSVSAGFSAGLLTLPAGLNLVAGGNGATNVWELAALKDDATGVAGTDFDQIVVTGGTLTLSPQANVDIRFTGSASAPDAGDPFWQSAHSWTIISLSGGSNPTSSNFGVVNNGSYAAGNFTTATNESGIVLTFTPNSVPPLTGLRITTITGAGTGVVTVYYTNTIPGTNYFLAYSTNLAGTNWFTAGSKTAAGTSDFQTDNSAVSRERYYRVYYEAGGGVPEPPGPPAITNIFVSSNSFCFTWASLPGVSYHVQGLTNLNSMNWVVVSPTLTAVDYSTTWCVTLPSPFQFFRVVQGPAPGLRITTIAGAGTGVVTVYYTNAFPGTNYFLSYSTNLAGTNWFTVGSKTAAGTSDFQTDNAAAGDQRYYRVSTVAGASPPGGMPPAITNIFVSSNSFCFTWASLPGVSYHVQGLTNLNSTNWVVVSPTLTAVDDSTTWCVSSPSPFQFFRVLEGTAPTLGPPPAITSLVRTNNVTRMEWTGPVDAQYQVQWTPALAPATWNTFTNIITSPTGVFEFVDDNSQTGGVGTTRFYRLTQLP